jgi:hypothetical protein
MAVLVVAGTVAVAGTAADGEGAGVVRLFGAVGLGLGPGAIPMDMATASPRPHDHDALAGLGAFR